MSNYMKTEYNGENKMIPDITTRGIIHIGTVCNLNCRHCYYYDSRRKWKPLWWLIAWITLIRLCRMDKIDISGGEPTIYPHIKILVRFCRIIGFNEIRLVTNGTQVMRVAANILCLPSRKISVSKAQEIIDKSRVMFSVSVHSSNEDDLYGLTGQKILSKIKTFYTCFGDRINYTNIVISPFNTDIHKIAEGVRDATDSKVLCFKHLDYNFPHGIQNFRMDEYRAALNQSISAILAKDSTIRIDMRFFPFCFLAEDLIEHPQIRMCSAIENVTDTNDWNPLISRRTPIKQYLKFIFGTKRMRWEASLHQAKIVGARECKHTRKCKGCKYETRCDGVQDGYLKLFGDSEFRPIRKR